MEVGLACNWSMLNQVEIPLTPFFKGGNPCLLLSAIRLTPMAGSPGSVDEAPALGIWWLVGLENRKTGAGVC